MNSVEQELIATALPYWETEAAIVRRFFASKPSPEDHIFWLQAQLVQSLTFPVKSAFSYRRGFIERSPDNSRSVNDSKKQT